MSDNYKEFGLEQTPDMWDNRHSYNKENNMFEYLSLGAVTKKFGAKEFPSPSKVWATLNKAEKAMFDRMMQDKNSAVYKAVVAGRRAHMTLEHDDAQKDAFQEALLETYDRDIAIDIDETWAKEQGVVSLTHKYRGKFDGVGVYKGIPTVWDYKKTNKIKTPSGVKKYLKQCSAYAIAHNEMYGTDISQIAIFNIGGKTIEDLSTRVFIYDMNDGWKDEWLNDVKRYWKEVQSYATLPI